MTATLKAIDEIIAQLSVEHEDVGRIVKRNEDAIAELRVMQAKIDADKAALLRAREFIAAREPKDDGKPIVMHAEIATVIKRAPAKSAGRKSKIERAVTSTLNTAANAPMTTHQLASAAQVSSQSMSRFLKKAVERHLMVRTATGRYALNVEAKT